MRGVPGAIYGLAFTDDRHVSFMAADGARTWTTSMRLLADGVCKALGGAALTESQWSVVRKEVVRVVGEQPLDACEELATATPNSADPAR